MCEAFQGDGKRAGSDKKQPFLAFLFQLYERERNTQQRVLQYWMKVTDCEADMLFIFIVIENK